ncbi:MAG TPA: molybdenum cofactor biosynthesis protein MoaE [Gemmatimonadales bacterium]|jgi:molybdopterin synthase catalytic subunit|nr:molybdenum cofactor biosynthesis protein MoaE [Gemmatimonadales bacterium]
MMHLTRHPIDVATLLADVQSPERGGTCVFLGTVRNDGDVTAIDYSAYEAMAFAEIERILREAQERWPDARVMLQHRLGVIPAGEASIAITAAAPHRDEAFAACRFVIEEVKQRLPIWKKELHADGSATWIDPAGKQVAGGLRDR